MVRSIKRVVPVLALLLMLLATGCSGASSAQDPATLEGVEWHLQSSSLTADDLSVVGITAAFKGTEMSGFSGVNRYNGGFTAETDGTFSSGPFAGTLMAGPEPLMKAETAYLELLEKCSSFSVEGGVLTLTADDGTTLTFEAAKDVELPGTKWVVTGYNTGKQAVSGPMDGSTLTLEFGTDGQVSGQSGVNSFSGPFESDAGTIKIGPLAATMMAGDPELMTQEAAYLAALQASVSWEVVNGVLDMRDADGAMQVLATPSQP